LLIFGHVHKYVILENGITTTNDRGEKYVTGRWYISRCPHCGKIKRDNLRS